MEALEICRKEAGILPLWILDPDEVETAFNIHNEQHQMISPYQLFVLDYTSALSIQRDKYNGSSDSISICGVTLTDPLSSPPTIAPNQLNIKNTHQSSSSPNLLFLENKEYLENLRISTNWKEIMDVDKVKRSKSLDSLAIVNIRECMKIGVKGALAKFKGIIDKTMKSRKVIRKITFAVEENKNEEKKEKKKMISPPPMNDSDGEKADYAANDDALEKNMNFEKKQKRNLRSPPPPTFPSINDSDGEDADDAANSDAYEENMNMEKNQSPINDSDGEIADDAASDDLLQEHRNIEKNQKRTLISLPPPKTPPTNNSDGEEANDVLVDEMKKVNLSKPQNGEEKEETIAKEQNMSVPKLLVHSASFYSEKTQQKANISVCPPTPRKIRGDGGFEKMIKNSFEEPERISVVLQG